LMATARNIITLILRGRRTRRLGRRHHGPLPRATPPWGSARTFSDNGPIELRWCDRLRPKRVRSGCRRLFTHNTRKKFEVPNYIVEWFAKWLGTA
jgi:hypothetical protein